MASIDPKTATPLICWTPTDVIAIVLIVGCVVLMAMGIDTVVEAILLSVASAYFAISHKERHDGGAQV